jgi:O-antigen/teichoic acid export membrane protein
MVKGASWIVAWRVVTRGLGLVSTIILVRLLLPTDFGLVTLATSIAQALENLAAVGVYEALIREPEPDRAMYDTGFTLNLLRSLFVALCIAAGASAASRFFTDPRLAPILFALAAMSVIAACENIGIVQFRRDITFEKEFLLMVVPRIAGILTTVLFAMILRDYRALIAGLAVLRVTRLLLSYRMHPYRPGITLQAWRRIIGFSFWTWISATANMIKDRTDTFVIGRVLGPAKVGVYAIGMEVGALATTELLEPITTALFAGFSSGRREGADIPRAFFKAISITFILTLPAGVGISLVAAPLIALMFGERWLEAIPLVQIFALLGVTKAIPYFSSVLLAAHAQLKIQFRIVMVGLAVRLILLFTLIGPLGLMGAVIAAVSCFMAEEILFLIVTFRLFKLRVVDLLHATWRSILATVAMAMAVAAEGIGWAPPASGTLQLATDLLTAASSGAIVYCAVLLTAWRLSGRPEGAETLLLGVVQDTWRHTTRNMFVRRA